MIGKKLFLSLLMIPVLMFVLVSPAQAFVVDNDGSIAKSEVIEDDVFLSSDIVTVDGTVNGMLFATGREVIINGMVNGDAVLAGQKITVSKDATITGNLFIGSQLVTVAGTVNGSLFTGCNSMVLSDTASVRRNLYFGGYSLKTEPGSVVAIDMAIGGYQAVLGGAVKRDIKAGLGALQLNGEVGRDLDVQVEAPGKEQPPMMFMSQMDVPAAINTGLVISEAATIGRNLNYTSSANQSAAIQAKPGGTVLYSTPAPDESETKKVDQNTPRARMDRFFKVGIGKAIVDTARRFITLFLAGVLALWLVPGLVKKLVDTIKARPVPSAGYGFASYFLGLAAIGVGIAVVIAISILLGLISLGGLSGITFWSGTTVMVAFTTGFFFMVGLGSQIVLSFLVGEWILTGLFKVVNPNRFVSLLLGVVLFVLVRGIPVLGWLAAAAITLFGLGALWIYLSSLRKPAVA